MLSLDDIALSYRNKSVLSEISYPGIKPGTLIGLLGANGVGKSSLLRAIAGLQSYQGQARFNGTVLSSLPHSKRSQTVSYLPQTLPQPTSLVAYEAVISAIRAVNTTHTSQGIEALAEDIFDRLAIRHLAFEQLNTMSGGQRQLVGLAQVIARKPQLLLLDEPTSALDLNWQLRVFQIVSSIVRESGGICLMAIHDINLALRHCDGLLLLANGKLLAAGSPLEVMNPENLSLAYGVEGRVELCSNGNPFVIADGVLPSQNHI